MDINYLSNIVSEIQSSPKAIAFSVISLALIPLLLSAKSKTLIQFCYYCFIAPFTPSSKKKAKSSTGQQSALEAFYEAQATIYDATRKTLLHGREESLQLAACHVQKKKELVWVDVGGGTGWNVEFMNSILPLMDNFKAIYIVDLSPSLLEVAKTRFDALGITNVHCVLEDACTFSVPHESVDLITFSYSLSMIPTFHSTIDHVKDMLHKDGTICCVDFGVQSDVNVTGRANCVGGLTNRHTPWIFRAFWRLWFEADRVFLDPARRDYLEYRFGTLKSLNCYNKTLGNIPYYIWLGCDKDKSPALLHRINALATESPYLAPQDVSPNSTDDLKTSKGHEAAISNKKRNLPYPSLYYQDDIYRVYYDEMRPEYNQFNNQYIYAFTWEDPREDDNILHFTKEDTVLAITSAGDNVLSYSQLPNAPRRIHCVDLNPSQGHLMELKLAAFKSLSRKEIWEMFGVGKIANFKYLLVNKMAPHMSSNAFQYWHHVGPKTFDIYGHGLYDTGFSKWALRMAKYLFKFTNTKKYIDQLCACDTMKEQMKIWETKIKPTLLNPVVSKLLIGNPIFLWKALGVPANQATLMGPSVLKYVKDTFEPLITRSLISKDNYFYYLTLQGQYSPENCPDYLTKEAYNKFSSKDASPLDNIRIHTDFLNDVFARLTTNSLTIAIIMDHMDWFSPGGHEVDDEIMALHQALCIGGRVMLRSASPKPWYIENFEKLGFSCVAAGTRTSELSIDRVNMYASTWVCTKNGKKRNMSVLDLNK